MPFSADVVARFTPLLATAAFRPRSLFATLRRLSVPTLLICADLLYSGCVHATADHRHAFLVRHAPAPDIVSAGSEFAAAEQAAARDPACFALLGAGASMAPLYAHGTAIVVREQSFCSLRPGMAVVYRHRRGHYVAHSLLEPRRGGWVALGLNNAEPDDEFVTEQNFVGVIKAAYASTDTAFRAALAARLALHDEVERSVRTAALP